MSAAKSTVNPGDIPRALVRGLVRETLRRGGHARRPRGAFVARLIGKLLGEGSIVLEPELRGSGYFGASRSRAGVAVTRLDRIAELLLEALACPDPGEQPPTPPKPTKSKKPRRERKEGKS